MAQKATVAAFPYFQSLFEIGAIGGLTDRQLIESFVQRNGEASELAFEVLVGRHGSMVHQICRSILDDPNDADDAFQATFLVLATRADSLNIRDSLGPWLNEVARRTAACARAVARRRRRHELAASSETRQVSGPMFRQHDLAQILDDEVKRIPERYRVAVTVCLVDGLTHRQAAERLNWRIGTVQSRLARGRELLRRRLSRRGIVPGAFVMAEAALRQSRPSRASGAHSVDDQACDAYRAEREGANNDYRLIGCPGSQRDVCGAAHADLRALLLIAFLCIAGAFRAIQTPADQHPPAAAAQAKPVDQKAKSDRTVAPYRVKLVAPSDVKASAGRGKFLVFALEESARRNQANGAFEERLEEHRWAVVIGVLDHDAIRKSLGLAAALAANRGTAPDKVQPEYRRLDVQRQDRRSGGDWSAWTDVDLVKNGRILGNVPEVEVEELPEQLRHDALTDPLPYLKEGRWDGAGVEWLRSIKQQVESPPPIAKGVGGRMPIQPIEAPEIMVRSVDFTVERGLSYRYRLRVVIDSSDRVGQRREVLGPWSEPTVSVTISD